jgi:hypothetical protein
MEKESGGFALDVVLLKYIGINPLVTAEASNRRCEKKKSQFIEMR